MRLVLLRHGRTEANARRLYCGFSDVPLSDAGRRELAALRNTVRYPDISGMIKITSGMLRTDETLRILFGCGPDVRMPQLREMNFGSFEMHSYDDLKDQPDYQAWIMDEAGEVCTPGGESSAQFRKRIFAAIDGIEGDALILCHGGVIAALMQRWFPEEGKNMYQWQSGFGLGYALEIRADHREYRAIAPGEPGEGTKQHCDKN